MKSCFPGGNFYASRVFIKDGDKFFADILNFYIFAHPSFEH
jgi:hypothetical protein